MTFHLPAALLMGKSALELFDGGGPVMWPILFVSFVAVTVVAERMIFLLRVNSRRQPEVVEKMLDHVTQGDIGAAVQLGQASPDYVARVMLYGLTHREHSLTNAFLRAANRELAHFQQGLPTLDTCITAAPLLGLLGTVTGMMNTFSALGSGDITANADAITGGVGGALIATACGLAIAIIGLLPYNLLNARLEDARHEIADASSALELLLQKNAPPR